MTFHELHALFTDELLALGFAGVERLRITHHKDNLEVEYRVTEAFGSSVYFYFYTPTTTTPEMLLQEFNLHLTRHAPQVDRELLALNEATAKVVALSKDMHSEAAIAYGRAFAETLAANSTSLPAPK